MRIVDRKTFMELPAGTMFAKYQPCVFEDLRIKEATLTHPGGMGDFCYSSIADAIVAHDSGEFVDRLEDAQENGVSLAMDFDVIGRDGCFDADQLFAVYERADVLMLIEKLTAIVAEPPQ